MPRILRVGANNEIYVDDGAGGLPETGLRAGMKKANLTADELASVVASPLSPLSQAILGDTNTLYNTPSGSYLSDGTSLQLIGGSPGSTGVSVNIKSFGAKCDAIRKFSGGSMTAGSPNFTDPAASFSVADVGKQFWVPGAAVGGKLLSATILAAPSSTSVVLSVSAAVSVSSAPYLYGTDDSAAWVGAANSVADGVPCSIVVPYGVSIMDGVALRNNTSIEGVHGDGWAFKNLRRCSGVVLKPGSTKPAMFSGLTFSVGNIQVSKLMMDGAFRFQGNTVNRYSGATTVEGSNVVNFTNGTFTSADIGKKLAVFGAGVGGSLQESAYVGVITAVTDANTVTVDDANGCASLSKSDAAYCYGLCDQAGLDAACTSNSTTVTCASANFTAADVGKVFEVYEAMLPQWGDGTANKGDALGEQLVTHIVAVLSPTSVQLHVAPQLTVTGKKWRLGAHAGFYQMESSVSQDSIWYVDRCAVQYFAGNGYNMGLYQRAQRINQTYFWQCMGHGMWCRSTDNQFFQCMWAECGEDGLHITQSSNHFVGGDSFNNEGNGIYLGGYAGACHFVSFMLDMNGKNGILDFSSGSQFIAPRFTTNSQRKNAVYNDYSCCNRYQGGVTNLNKSGTNILGGFWGGSGSAKKPAYGLNSVGPYGIRGSGVQWNPDTSPFALGSVASGIATSLHQHSFQIEGGTTLTFSSGNTLKFDSTVGTKIGSAATEKLSFYGNPPLPQQASAAQAAVSGTAGATYGTAEQALLNATVTLVNRLRQDIAALGLIKGSA